LVERIAVEVFVVPTDRPESDGTLAWDHTTIVAVHAHAGGEVGLGYTYADRATAFVVHDVLAPVVVGSDPLCVSGTTNAMVRAVRNLGRRGIASMAISAVDVALHDLRAKLLGAPLVDVLGRARDSVAVYGSGGFCSYDDATLGAQLAGWIEHGIARVKMKVGRGHDVERVRVARAAIGDRAELFVDANGAWSRKNALRHCESFAEFDVRWMEEPVSSEDLEGLALIRDRAPSCMEIAAGEYGYDERDFVRMLPSIDVLQADATRCGGITGFLHAAAIADAQGIELSAHCAPALHLHAACAHTRMAHVEWFHDHARIESMLFEGAPMPRDGFIAPDRSRHGLGLELKRADAARFAVGGP
jgi:L-alanine-DL-glutamate epimerase-like enolase superfamily enzyme